MCCHDEARKNASAAQDDPIQSVPEKAKKGRQIDGRQDETSANTHHCRQRNRHSLCLPGGRGKLKLRGEPQATCAKATSGAQEIHEETVTL